MCLGWLFINRISGTKLFFREFLYHSFIGTQLDFYSIDIRLIDFTLSHAESNIDGETILLLVGDFQEFSTLIPKAVSRLKIKKFLRAEHSLNKVDIIIYYSAI